ncbi:G5 domain-containing protein [Streptococcus pluranimalium]|uniref:G5 domain-containing protein n=1 Tax=Streptococcus pluranimalium TaxID=82348 RepID=UPI002414E8BF|nr:G5 domain-containing protein [Streptococcus pluranimalium]WFM79941.1 G5 domain-containing protein [Streptococcus pluranimalium]
MNNKQLKKLAVVSAITLFSSTILSSTNFQNGKLQLGTPVVLAEDPPVDEDVPSGPEMQLIQEARQMLDDVRLMLGEGESEVAKEMFEEFNHEALKAIPKLEVKAPGLLAEIEKLRGELYGTTPAPTPQPQPQPTPPTPAPPVETTENVVVIEPIAAGEKRVANPDMEVGKETRTPGTDGEALVTYKVYKKDGVEYKREEIDRTVKTPAVDTIVEYGTKQPPVVVVSEIKVEEPIKFTSRTVENPNLEKGKRNVVTPGKDGVKTVTYAVRTVDGKEIERNKVSEEITTPAIEEVIEIGTKEVKMTPWTPIVVPVVTEETETEEIPFTTETRENPNLPKGETRVVQEGKNGSRTVVYTVVTVDGKETGRTVKSDTTVDAVTEIVEVGTKVTPKVETLVETATEPVAYTSRTVENPDLLKGETRVVQEGKDGVRTITYRVTTIDGIETDRVVLSDEKTPAVVEIIEVGTKVVTPNNDKSKTSKDSESNKDSNNLAKNSSSTITSQLTKVIKTTIVKKELPKTGDQESKLTMVGIALLGMVTAIFILGKKKPRN